MTLQDDIARDFEDDFRSRQRTERQRRFRNRCMDTMCGAEDCDRCHPELNNEQEEQDEE